LPLIPAKPPETTSRTRNRLETALANEDSLLVAYQAVFVKTKEKDVNERMERAYSFGMGRQLMMPSKSVDRNEISHKLIIPMAVSTLKICQSRKARAYDKILNKFLKIPFRQAYQLLNL
jgi:hypothetical protein